MTDLIQEYVDFVCRRQSVFLSKVYTSPSYIDPLLGTNKFTNVHRIFDRVSQYELKKVMYSHSQDFVDILLRVFIFNQFKTEVFWDYLLSRDYIPEFKSFSVNEFISVISEYSGKDKLFTSAYVVPGKSGQLKATTIAERASILTQMYGGLTSTYSSGNTDYLFSQLKTIPGIGDFLGSQVVFDLLWHDCLSHYKPLFVLGVGATRGAFKLGFIDKLKDILPTQSEYALKLAMRHIKKSNYVYAIANKVNIHLDFASIQNTFCEVDKWFRLIHPELQLSKSSPKKIKNVYKPRPAIDYQVPGWWVNSKDTLVSLD